MSVNQSESAEKFQRLHGGPGTFVIPNPWDAGTACMLAALGDKCAGVRYGTATASLRCDHSGMLDKKAQRALLEATRVSVRKEMAKPRMTRSARIAVRNLEVVKASKHPRTTAP
jgi:2-methylisocitrate lyase-like PEP mutase family enzyme